MTMRKSVKAAVAVLALSTHATYAQGIPVIDKTAILRWASQLEAMKEQFDALNQQIAQVEQLYGSLNKLTNMTDVASLLNNPHIRKALPQDFATINRLLRGHDSDAFPDAAGKVLASNETSTTQSTDSNAQELPTTHNPKPN